MEKIDISKSTGRDVQSNIFLKSLRNQMSTLSSSLRKQEMIKTASSYMADGCSGSETKELLLLDGFDKDLVHNYLSKIAIIEREDNDVRWGFDIEDNYGRILTHDDLGIELYAGSESVAREKAENMLRSAGSDPELERVVSVYQVS